MKTAIGLLNCFCDNQSVPEQDKSVFRQAIRVLEAARETDRETLLGNFDSLVASCHGGFTPGDEEFKPCFEGCVEGIRMIRALLEALPEEKK